jgi:hypothetical protein
MAPLKTLAPAPQADTPAPSGSQDTVQRGTDNKVQRLKRYAGSFLPFGVGSAITLKYGIDEVREGNTKNGIVDAVRGVAGILDNANLLVYLSAVVPIAGPILTVAGTIGAISGIIAAPLDGGRDVVEGLHGLHTHAPPTAAGNTPRQTTAIGAVKLAAAGLSIAGSLTANPILLAAGTVVGMSAMLYQNRAAIAHVAHKVVDKVFHHGQDPSASAATPHPAGPDAAAPSATPAAA